MIFMLVLLRNHGRSFQFSEGSMKEEMARAVPWLLSILADCLVWTAAVNLALLRMSRSRRPSWGASTVMNNPLKPRDSALRITSSVTFLSLFTYSCHHCVWPAARAPAISSIVQLARVGHIWITPCACAARAIAISPSGVYRRPRAQAVTYTGKELGVPRMVVLMSTCSTSTSTRGLRYTRWYAAWFSRIASSSSAPLIRYPQASLVTLLRATRSKSKMLIIWSIPGTSSAAATGSASSTSSAGGSAGVTGPLWVVFGSEFTMSLGWIGMKALVASRPAYFMMMPDPPGCSCIKSVRS
mmetsp:Transcript_42260/g.92186  ORF Transcript_42260/g.92186 Transcript_42260/m.92186 type:complete len:298 (-) Transcript_42260:129-1022(-)